MASCPLCESTDFTLSHLGPTRIQKCSNCHLWFIPAPEIEGNYDKTYYAATRADNHDLNALRTTQYEIDARHLHRHIQSGNLIDAGCSIGAFIDALDAVGRYTLLGIDPDLSAIEVARKRTGSSHISFECCDCMSLEPRQEADALIFRGSFQFLGANLAKTLARVKTLLKKGGLLFIYVLPNSDSFVFRLLGEKWSLFDPVYHRLIFNSKSIEQMCRLFDFEIVELSYPYLETVYADIEKDYNSVIGLVRGEGHSSPPFWGNIIQLVLRNR
ncbi:MAG TPA: class I SAM-dependent methyltransferase [Candidatus Ozemobacteraceae bacterium]|nr:class I SAM-dependent methyltransferase [Candidatus Ozemobacteraceae bacterium]